MKKKSTLKWLWDVTGKYKKSIFLLLLVQVCISVAVVSSAWILKSVINNAVNHDRNRFIISTIMFIGITLLQIIFNAFNRYLQEYTKSGTENIFKHRMFACLMNKNYENVTAVHSAEWMNRLTSDTTVIAEGATVIVPEVTGMIVKLTGALVSLIILIPELVYILLPGGLFLVALTYAFRKKLKKLHKNIQESDGKLRIFMTERLSSLMVVKAFCGEKISNEKAEEKMNDHRSARMKRNHFSNICNTGFAIIMRGAYLAGAVYCGYGIMQSTITYGTFTAVLQLISQIQSPFANITGYLPKYFAMTASAERIMEVESYTNDRDSEVLSDEKIKDFYKNDFQSVVFENVSFSYNSEAEEDMPIVLNNFNLEIKKGKYTAFTGHSGCGKSTVLKLILSLYKAGKGKVYLRTCNGDISLDSSYRSLFSYVPQGNHLMSGKLRDVIAFSHIQNADDDDRIYEALKIACADEFLSELPDGLDTVLGENGAGISEGQMQRLAIARAVFSEHPFLLLDEATSSLDEITERKVLENLRNLTDKTVIIITHRPAALEICDCCINFGE